MIYTIDNPEIEKTFVISTGHVTEQDMRILSDKTLCLSTSSDYDSKIHIETFNDTKKDFVKAGLSKAFFDVMDSVNVLGCHRISFDSDGPTYDNLPIFEW